MLKVTIDEKQFTSILNRLANHKFTLIHAENKIKAKQSKNIYLRQMLQNLANLGQVDFGDLVHGVEIFDDFD